MDPNGGSILLQTCLSYVDDGADATNSPRILLILDDIAYRHACMYHYELHAVKSCIVVYGNLNQRNVRQPVGIYIGNKTIPQKQSATHLGVIVAQTRPQKSAPSELLWSLSVNK